MSGTEKSSHHNHEAGPEAQRINIEYNGTLSQHLNWLEDEIVATISALEIRSDITIRGGSGVVPATYPGLESALTMAVLSHSMFGENQENEFFSRKRKDGDSHVIITLHDQAISAKVREGDFKDFNTEFSKRLNDNLQEALLSIAIQEEYYRIIIVCYYFLMALLATVPLILSTTVIGIFIANNPEYLRTPAGIIGGSATLAITTGMVGYNYFVHIPMLMKMIDLEAGKLHSRWDLLPYIHVKSAIEIVLHKWNPATLVELKMSK